ncbi:MAG: UDP-N-acetylglucosamine 2-epimerase (non-hydrolyzing), partial [Magnetococcus sp. DMHC-6]
MKLLLVAGARPNFMKIAPIYRAMSKKPERFQPYLVHTGQHYDPNMSADFFRDLNLPTPHFFFEVGSGSHGVQTAAVMVKMEALCFAEKPDWVVVVGDVNSTMAATLAAVKLGIRVAHVEAGLRSRDRRMPEEINRIVTDSIADLLLTPSRDGDDNLIQEGIPKERICFVGNVMIDSLVATLPLLEKVSLPLSGDYGVVTLHRPSNVDQSDTLSQLLKAILPIADFLPLVFPMHPRTRAALERFDLLPQLNAHPHIHLYPPQGYQTFMAWLKGSRMAITDSGGIQEETTFLKIPCLTLRENTERPITITHGTNQLVTLENLLTKAKEAMEHQVLKENGPEFWDGRLVGGAGRSVLKRHGCGGAWGRPEAENRQWGEWLLVIA